jgi:hypothetical protein
VIIPARNRFLFCVVFPPKHHCVDSVTKQISTLDVQIVIRTQKYGYVAGGRREKEFFSSMAYVSLSPLRKYCTEVALTSYDPFFFCK